MSHDHDHGEYAHHYHGDPDSRTFLIAIALNIIFVVVEFSYGLIANSTALIADAGHNLADVLGLILAGGAAILAKRKPAGRYTYGLRSTSILAAVVNAMFLMVSCGAIAWEAGLRLYEPHAVSGMTVIVVAGFGIVVNGLSAWLFMRGREHDLNLRGAYLHMAADAAVSLGVVVAGIIMLYTGWYWLDSAISLVIVLVILLGTWGLLRDAVKLAVDAVPEHIDPDAVADYLRQCRGIAEIHDLHIWGMSTTESALTVHLVMPEGYPGDELIDQITQDLKAKFSIGHSTLQVEMGTTDHACMLHAAHAH